MKHRFDVVFVYHTPSAGIPVIQKAYEASIEFILYMVKLMHTFLY